MQGKTNKLQQPAGV